MTRKTLITLFVCFVAGACLPPLVGLFISCTPQQEPKTVESVAKKDVQIADDVCHEVEKAGITNEWVALTCAGLDTATILMPRQEWRAIRARHSKALDGGKLDTGPGL